ncbi:hypothetical protein SK069_14230 [Patulibacter brassicae]|uniref:DUF732 domain-containing protein n=1 Tax=Patulibacter brassicae TaxID=1705717 RepID=A0ABU4VP98_9ACTN|nr:hypothetical protein [Patulibacter brassicae]MDX8152761.1 hypothetical protein [Patulibacter brassicae]
MRTFALVTLVVVTFGLTGCGSDSTDAANEPDVRTNDALTDSEKDPGYNPEVVALGLKLAASKAHTYCETRSLGQHDASETDLHDFAAQSGRVVKNYPRVTIDGAPLSDYLRREADSLRSCSSSTADTILAARARIPK